MNDANTRPLVLGLPSYREPARRLAKAAGYPYADVDIHGFPDGESRVRLPSELPDDVVLCVSLDHPNAKLVELEFAAATARRLGVTRIRLVAPYLCYMRQDTAFNPGEAISQTIIGQSLARQFDGLVTVDPHLHRVHDLQQAVPVRDAVTLTAAPLMAAWLAQQGGRPILLGPDTESAQWVGAIARAAGLEFGVAEKQRLGDRDVRIRLPDIVIKDRDLVLVDDVASSGQTLIEAATRALEAGARRVSVLVTHALFVGDAVKRLRRTGVESIVSTDSVVHPSNAIALAPLLAEALHRH